MTSLLSLRSWAVLLYFWNLFNIQNPIVQEYLARLEFYGSFVSSCYRKSFWPAPFFPSFALQKAQFEESDHPILILGVCSFRLPNSSPEEQAAHGSGSGSEPGSWDLKNLVQTILETFFIPTGGLSLNIVTSQLAIRRYNAVAMAVLWTTVRNRGHGPCPVSSFKIPIHVALLQIYPNSTHPQK